MPDTKITLYAISPVKAGGKRCFEEEFQVDTQAQADALIACGAAKSLEAEMIDEAAAAELQKMEDDKKVAAEKAAAEKLAADKEKEKEKNPAGGKADNVVSLVRPPESAEDRLAAIKKVTVDLQVKNDKEKFTTSNGPTVDALTEVLGWKPNAKERNQVWLELVPAE